jgi:hypothetical protein
MLNNYCKSLENSIAQGDLIESQRIFKLLKKELLNPNNHLILRFELHDKKKITKENSFPSNSNSLKIR